MNFDNCSGDILLSTMFRTIEIKSGQSLAALRAECEKANRVEGKYPKKLREKIACIRRTIEGADGYERITRGRPIAFGYRLSNERGLNLPWDDISRLKDSVWKYLCIDKNKDKDSIGMSIWKSFYDFR